MKAKLKEYELFTKLFIILFIALFTQAIIISLFIYHQSKEAYINLFDKSNEQSLVKIQRDFEMLNDNIEKTLSSIAENPGVESYFSTENQPALSQLSDLKEIHQMTLGFTAISPYIDYDLMIFGENGRTFVGNDLIASMDANAFFQLEIRNKIDQVSASTQMVFVDFGLTQKSSRKKYSFCQKIADFAESSLWLCCHCYLFQTNGASLQHHDQSRYFKNLFA